MNFLFSLTCLLIGLLLISLLMTPAIRISQKLLLQALIRLCGGFSHGYYNEIRKRAIINSIPVALFSFLIIYLMGTLSAGILSLTTYSLNFQSIDWPWLHYVIAFVGSFFVWGNATRIFMGISDMDNFRAYIADYSIKRGEFYAVENSLIWSLLVSSISLYATPVIYGVFAIFPEVAHFLYGWLFFILRESS